MTDRSEIYLINRKFKLLIRLSLDDHLRSLSATKMSFSQVSCDVDILYFTLGAVKFSAATHTVLLLCPLEAIKQIFHKVRGKI